jgi:indolepyruvate ferredoxin oxidoreductase alpha subunit
MHGDALIEEREGASVQLLGNDAIVRGALEAGVAFMAGYPGTPSSEVTDSFARVSGAHGVAFEYSVNEKIALELAFAASLAGARSLCAMKHLGLMVAGDPLSTIPYIGVEGGMVIVSAGDPSCHTSPNEADQRHLGPMLHLPILDPSTPAEAHAMTRAAFELSEACRLPVLLRTTTRVAHSRGAVTLGAFRPKRETAFVREPGRYVPIPANARRMRIAIKDRLAKARAWMAQSGFFRVDGEGEDVVLATGAPAATAADVLRLAAVTSGVAPRVALWRLGTIFPLPEAELVSRLAGVKRLVVVEELSPFLEERILVLCARHGLSVQVFGKLTGHFPEEFEYSADVVQRGLHGSLGIGAPPPVRPAPVAVPIRAPSLCPGCPHRAAFFAARSAFDADQIYMNDIGCYTLGFAPPLRTADALLCMGAGFTLAAGVARVTGKRTVGFMGDSTFFHAGMPALLDAIKEHANVVAVVLDNQITAMTGFQQSPTQEQKIEDVARALGARHVETIDPYDSAASIAAFQRAKGALGTSVVVVRRACPIGLSRTPGAPPRPAPYVADVERCRTCGRDAQHLGCEQQVTDGYERNLARVAAQREQLEPQPSVAPCAARCPLSLCIQGYAGHIAAGEWSEALGHVMARTPLPESVCRVCDRPCEDVCVRGALDAPVAINDLKRFVVEWGERERPDLLTTPREALHGLRIAVVGAGPSGLAAAHELAVRGYTVTLFDAEREPGGMLVHGIPEYRLPAAMAQKDIARVLALGVTFAGGMRLGRDVTITGLTQEFDAVYVAIGAHRPRKLELAGARGATNVIDAFVYLRGARVGEPVPSGARVVVIGGGNAAIDAARTALRKGAVSVTVACLEERPAMPALRDEIAAAEHEGIAIRGGLRPVRWAEGGLVVAPVSPVSGPEESLDADLVIVAIGQDPDETALDGALERTSTGHLEIDRDTCATSHSRVFAGGDVVRGEHTVTAAMAWGLRAAWGIDVALRGRPAADRRSPPARPELERPRIAVRAPRLPRRHPPELDGRTRGRSTDEVVSVFAEADARAEAARCLMCGQCGNCRACIDVLGCPAIAMDPSGARVVVDPTWCIGCGVCAELCSDGAMAPVEAS